MTPQPNSEALRECALRLVELIRKRGNVSVTIYEAASALEAAARSPAETAQALTELPQMREARERKMREHFSPESPAEPEGNDAKKRMCYVDAEDANNYCRIVSLLGMEEEGDPVVEVGHLIAFRNRAESEGRGVTDEMVTAAWKAYIRACDDPNIGNAHAAMRASLESILPPSAAQAEWMPIETVPKNDTAVDLWLVSYLWTADGEKQKSVEFRVPDVRFWNNEWTDEDGNKLEIEGFEPYEFTHWMYPPAAPTKENGDE